MLTWLRQRTQIRQMISRAWDVGYAAGVAWRYADDQPVFPPQLEGEALQQWRRGFDLGHRVSLDGSALVIHRQFRPDHPERQSS